MSDLTFATYQQQATATAVYPERGTGSRVALAYVSLGLGEVGEVQTKVATIGDVPDVEQGAEVAAELGDVLWYIAQLATELNCELDALAGGHGTIAGFQKHAASGTTGSLRVQCLRLGVSGELQGRIKKILRGDTAAQTGAYKDLLLADMHTLLVEIARTAHLLGCDLGEIAQANLDKLADRARRGVLKGSGDHR